MKRNSLQTILEKSSLTFKRFPLSLLFSFLGAGTAIFLIHTEADPQKNNFYLFNLLTTCYLGMLVFIALPIYAERKNWNLKKNSLFQIIGIMVLGAYYYSLPNHFFELSTIRFVLFSLALHLLISFAPFLGFNEPNGFWQYNKSLFLRIALSVLYSGVLFIGLVLALVSINQLFKVHLSEKTYAYLWVLLAGVFNTWFFLSDFPSHFSKLERNTEYPKGLKIFTQFVLLPLLAVYLLILYSYTFKIVTEMQWPEGWVSYLVLFFSVAGILSLLLIYPVRNDDSNKWIPIFSRFFYFAIFPLLVLLFFAIKRRISEYGITESRYFVLLLALWLLFISSYFLISKIKNIKLIPISLFCLALLSSFGPWGAFSVSLRSQQNHLRQLLDENNLLLSGKAKHTSQNIPIEVNREISSVVEYIVKSHGHEPLQGYFSQNLDSLFASDTSQQTLSEYTKSRKILDLIGLPSVSPYEEVDTHFFNYSCVSNYNSVIEGYSNFFSDITLDRKNSYSLFSNTDTSYRLSFAPTKNKLLLRTPKSILELNLEPLLDSIKSNKYEDDAALPVKTMTLYAKDSCVSVKLICLHIQGETQEGKALQINSLRLDVFISSITKLPQSIK